MMVEDPDGNWLELVEATPDSTAGTDGLELTKDSIDLVCPYICLHKVRTFECSVGTSTIPRHAQDTTVNT
jgi:hypothetical protein